MRLAGWLVAFAICTLFGCNTKETTIEAPELHPGQDMCAKCSMIISEERFAGAIGLLKKGRVEHLLFDDIGEMLEFTPEAHEAIRWFAKDASTSEWVDAEKAVFLRSKGLTTPMGTGVSAYATQGSAEQAQSKYQGELLDFQALRPAHRAASQPAGT